jgi:hypothetical protein
MAFFCNQTGARIVAPGVSIDLDPTNGVPAYDDSPGARAAESAALAALRQEKLADEEASPSVPAAEQARVAAKKAFAPTALPKEPLPAKGDEPTKPDAPRGGRRPAVDPKDDKNS